MLVSTNSTLMEFVTSPPNSALGSPVGCVSDPIKKSSLGTDVPASSVINWRTAFPPSRRSLIGCGRPRRPENAVKGFGQAQRDVSELRLHIFIAYHVNNV